MQENAEMQHKSKTEKVQLFRLMHDLSEIT